MFRTFTNSKDVIACGAKQSLQRAITEGPLAQGHPPSPNDANFDDNIG